MAFVLQGCSLWPSTGSKQGVVSSSAAGQAPASAAVTASSALASGGAASAPNALPQAAAASAQAGSPQAPAFEQVIKGAIRQDGLLPIWTRQDKVWIELSPASLGKPYFLSPKLSTGIGEGGLLGGLMQSRWAQVGKPQWVEFRKVQQQVQLLAVNAAYTAAVGTPQARAVQAAFSPSLLSSVPLASAPQPTSGAVLIEATPLLLGDLLGIAQQLQRSYRQSYALDVRNSALLVSRSKADGLVFQVSQHFATGGISIGGLPGGPSSIVPASLPDPRSLFVTVHYTLSALPAKPMPTRPADPRVGYFSSSVVDFTDDLTRSPRQRFINRWRLEKKVLGPGPSDPVKPLVYWLDPSIPLAYRAAITDGVMAWNQAFEAIGVTHAIEVKEAPADGSVDTQETGHMSIRWMTNSQPIFGAIGPTHVDPRSGEILDADIALESLSSRAIRTVKSQWIGSNTADIASQANEPKHSDQCQHADQAAEQLGLALEVLQAQGALDPNSLEVQQFVLAYIKDTTMHEVGHTLGLRHNFRASRWHTAQELNDPVLTQKTGNSASVMDYAPINLPKPGQTGGMPFQTTLGPYDFWAIEYGYGDVPEGKDAQVKALRQIAERSAQPQWREALAYGTDEDQQLGLDPQALTFDLGRDPVVFAQTRLDIVADLFKRQNERRLTPDDDPALLRRSVNYGLRDLARTSQILLRQVGGVVTRRDAPGAGREMLIPLSVAEQQSALSLLTQAYLSSQAVTLPPTLLRKLAPDYLEREMALDGGALGGTEFSLAEQQLALQRDVVAGLLNEGLAERLLDNADMTRDTVSQALTPAQVFAQVREAIWPRSEAANEPASLRRNLQREHINRLAVAVIRNASARADVRALIRQEAKGLLTMLRARAPQARDAATQAHLQDGIDTLTTALQASALRTSP